MSAARATVVVLVVALAGASCGGDRLSPKGFAHQATEICRRVSRAAAGTDLPPLTERQAAARAIERLVAKDRDALRDLRDLDPPTPATDRVAPWLAVIDQMLDEADLVVRALRQGDAAAATGAAARADTLAGRVHALGAANGVGGCRFPRLGTGT